MNNMIEYKEGDCGKNNEKLIQMRKIQNVMFSSSKNVFGISKRKEISLICKERFPNNRSFIDFLKPLTFSLFFFFYFSFLNNRIIINNI